MKLLTAFLCSERACTHPVLAIVPLQAAAEPLLPLARAHPESAPQRVVAEHNAFCAGRAASVLTLDLAHRHSSPPASQCIRHCTAVQPSLPAVSLSTASGTFSTGHSLPAPLSPAASANGRLKDPRCTTATNPNVSKRLDTACSSGPPLDVRCPSILPAHRAFPSPSPALPDPVPDRPSCKNAALAHPLRRLPSLPPAVRRKVALRERERRVCPCLAEYDDADTTSSDGASEMDEEERLRRMHDDELGLAGGERE